MKPEDVWARKLVTVGSNAEATHESAAEHTCVMLLNHHLNLVWHCPDSEVFCRALDTAGVGALVDVFCHGAEGRRLVACALEHNGWCVRRVPNPRCRDWTLDSVQRLIEVNFYRIGPVAGLESVIVCKAKMPTSESVAEVGWSLRDDLESAGPMNRLEAAYAMATAHGEQVGLAFVEVGQAEEYIDLFGEAAFEILLERAAGRIARLAAPPIYVARVSRTRYALFFTGLESPSRLQQTFIGLIELSAEPIRSVVDGSEVPLRVGVTVASEPSTFSQLTQAAASALDHAVTQSCKYPFLIVSDSLRRVMRASMLARLGYEVTSSESGEVLLEPECEIDTGILAGVIVRPLVGAWAAADGASGTLGWDEEQRALSGWSDSRERLQHLVAAAIECSHALARQGLCHLSTHLFIPGSVLTEPGLLGIIVRARRLSPAPPGGHRLGLLVEPNAILGLDSRRLDAIIDDLALVHTELNLVVHGEVFGSSEALHRLMPRHLFLSAALMQCDRTAFEALVAQAKRLGASVTVTGCAEALGQSRARSIGCSRRVGPLAGPPLPMETFVRRWQMSAFPAEIS